MNCDCLDLPPMIEIPPPPDPSLIWHLISDEVFEKPKDCEWNPFISISDISSEFASPLPNSALIAIAFAAVLILFVLLCLLICRILRRRQRASKSKASSSDAIMSCGDNIWTYNSMKSSNTGPNLYGSSHPGSRVFNQATPVTMRSFAGGCDSQRVCGSTTLRLHPNESLAYHSVAPPAEYYEEIPARGTLPAQFHIPPPPCSPPSSQLGRRSIRKPPPSHRPPPPPRGQHFSPTGSDGSVEKELQRLPSDSPPCRWEEEGRESGYGTAPSRQWRTPPGSGGNPERAGALHVLSQAGAQSMTYV